MDLFHFQDEAQEWYFGTQMDGAYTEIKKFC